MLRLAQDFRFQGGFVLSNPCALLFNILNVNKGDSEHVLCATDGCHRSAEARINGACDESLFDF